MSKTPITDFISTLADPLTLERFRANPEAVASEAGLSADIVQLILERNHGILRARAFQELEHAGFSALVSDKLNLIDLVAIYQPTTSTTHDTWVDVVAAFVSDVAGSPAIDSVDQAILYQQSRTFNPTGQLVVVGSGIRAISDLTLDAEAQIRTAQKVLYCVADPVTERRLHLLNSYSESLYGLYDNGKPRIETYRAMVDAMLAPVRGGLRVCGVFYGHPGVFAWPTHQAVRIARREGFRAEMHAGVSASAALFADLGLDPSQPGCHLLEATNFLIHRREPDVTSHLLLWQAECAGDLGFNFAGYKRHNFRILLEELRRFYPATHPVIVYEAASLPQGRPKIIKSSLDTIHKEQLTGISTLYLPPAVTNVVDNDMCRRLGL